MEVGKVDNEKEKRKKKGASQKYSLTNSLVWTDLFGSGVDIIYLGFVVLTLTS